MKVKEGEHVNKYLDLAREQKMVWNMSVTVIPTVICALGMIPKGFGKRLEELETRGRIDIIQTTELLTDQYTEKSPGDLKNLLSLRLQWKTTS